MKKLTLYVLGFLFLIIIGLFISAEIFEEKIGLKVKAEINKSIETEFHFEAFDFSLVRHFPSAAIRFQDVYILDNMGDTLMYADRLLVKMDLFSIIGDQINIKSAAADNGQIYIHIDKSGRRNYEIITPDDTVHDDTKTHFAINDGLIKDMRILYQDDQSESLVDLEAEELVIDLGKNENWAITLLGALHSNKIVVDDEHYLVNKNISVNSDLIFDENKDKLTLEESEFGLEGMVFFASGDIEFKGDDEIYDLVLHNTNGSLERVFRLLPENKVEELKKISSNGDFDLTVFYKGKQSKRTSPALLADVTLDNGRVVIPQIGIPLKNVSFSAKYEDRSKKGLQDASVHINGFKAKMDGEWIKGDFIYKNFSNPYLEIDGIGKMPIATLLRIVGMEASDMEGSVNFNNLKINGLLSDLSSPIKQSGTVSTLDADMDNISFSLKDKEILLRGGNLNGQNDYFELKGLEVRTPESVFEFDGHIRRLIPYLFAEYHQPELQFDMNVHSANCNVAEILELTAIEENNVQADQVATKSTANNSYIKNLDGDIDIKIDRFEHTDILGKSFNGRVTFNNGSVLVNGSASSMKGEFEVEGILQPGLPNNPIEAKVSCRNVDVKTFFKQTHNFGQKTIRSEHLKGRMDAQLLINADYRPDGTLNRNGLYVLGSMDIADGELVDFKMMENFSSYVKSQDLKHIKFGHLSNYFEIKNEVVHIPAMFIQSNAANLTLSGEHSFDNAIDYNIKVNAGQVLTNKLKKYNPRLSPIKARKKGFFNLYFVVDGTVDAPDYRTAKRRVKSDFVSSEYRKSKIESALTAAFPKVQLAPSMKMIRSTDDLNLQFADQNDEEYLDEIKPQQ